MSLAPGQAVGPYELLAPIGAGGMGEVWKARDPRLDRVVSIKFSADRFSARFEREAKAVAALNHPHICQIYDIGPNYLVLEFVDGKPLHGPLPVETAVRYAAQIADALTAAHAKGIVHRDLKPGNILVAASGVKLLDFGLARVEESIGDPDETKTLDLTQAGTILGTASYMSPEQAEGKPVDGRSDIFSFGVVLYEMLSGRRAFAGDSMVATLASILHKEPVAIETTSALREILQRCLRKAPADRFATAGQLQEALRGAAVKDDGPSPSIAVMPFANLSGDKDQEYFSDGLAEEIINALAKIPGLRVIARTSAFSFKGQNVDIRKIADTLKVATILEGSVRRAGNRIRVTAQLITAADSSQLWSERYDRDLEDVFAVQDEISAAIAGALHTKLSPQAAKPRYKPVLAAHEELLKGRYFAGKYTPHLTPVALQHYERAIQLDPNYALAHAERSIVLGGAMSLGLTSPAETARTMRADATRALELDSDLPEAHSLLGTLALFAYDWTEADRQFSLATGASASPYCHMQCGLCYLSAGRTEAAIAQFEEGLRKDPLHLILRGGLSQALATSGRYAEVEKLGREVIALDPQVPVGHSLLSVAYIGTERWDLALESAEQAYRCGPGVPQLGVMYAAMLQRAGEVERAKEIRSHFDTPTRPNARAMRAQYHALAGEMGQAVAFMEDAIRNREIGATLILNGYSTGRIFRESGHWARLMKLANLDSEK